METHWLKRLCLFLALASCAFAQTAPVQKTMPGNSVTGDLSFGSSRTVTFQSGSTLNVNSGVTVTGIPTATAASTALGALSPTAGYIPYFTSTTAAGLLQAPASTLVGISDTQTLTNKTLTAPTISGGIVFPADTQQVFAPGANNAGLNVGSVSSDPATPANGGLWYNSTSNNLYARINGSNVALGVSGTGTVTSIGLTMPTGFSVSGSPITTSGTLAVTLNGSVTWPSNTRQTFAPGSSASGLNVGTVTTDPSSPSNGDLWYNSTTPSLNARINGVTVNLGASGSGNVTGAASSTAHHLSTFGDTTGKLLEDFSTITASSAGVLTGSAGIGLTSTSSNNIVLTPGSGFVQIGPDATLTQPDQVLQVSTASSSASISVVGFGSAGCGIRGFAAGGTSSSPSVPAGNILANYIGGAGYNGSTWVGSKALVGEYTAETWSGTANGAYITFETTPTGSTTRAEAVRVTPNANLLIGSTTDITGSGHLQVNSSDDSTSTSTGAVRVVGGIGVAKKIISGSTVQGTQLISTIATGTAPLTVTSTTNVANLNASSLNGATFAAPGNIGTTTPGLGVFTGVTDGSSAASGVVGQFVTSNVASGSAVALTTGACSNVTSISLTAGDWDVTGEVSFVQASSTVGTYYVAGITTTSATLPTHDQYTGFGGNFQGVTSIDNSLITPVVHVNVSSTTTVYLIAQSAFTTSTLSAYGNIRARRVR